MARECFRKAQGFKGPVASSPLKQSHKEKSVSCTISGVTDLTCLESVPAHDDATDAVAADCGVVYSASANGCVKAWEIGKAGPAGTGAHSLLTIRVPRAPNGVSWNAGAAGRRVWAAGSDVHLLGWDLYGRKWSLAFDVKAYAMAVLFLCVAGDLVCTGSADKTIGRGAIGGHEGPNKCIQASLCRASNGYMVYSSGLDKSMRVWWVPNGANGDERTMKKCVIALRDLLTIVEWRI
ncbi:protein JINGUBANG-like [Aegilops tauschii subsp. strangulata]|uniref:protein JINGUBANG-like n=1 Tax=Aegilops tauschii subsp. strangulata TaxID=200361 RepID=UPI00098AF742|nr:protein JINGUBANG-like [Aegilops tauschii subsp. strangulata]